MKTVLVVEDDEMNREMISRTLRWEGYQVITAADGLEACERAASDRPDVILMDMGLPVLSGWEATRRLKADPELQSIPVVALTAYAMVEDRQRSLDAGCDGYATKPIDFKYLLKIMERLLCPA